jgi:alpha-ketoglutaric semialdehyde dehydrogenase
VKDYEEAFAVADAGEFGLSSGVVTTSLKHATDFQRRIRAGMTMINLPTAGVDYHVPFGGTKKSSFGPREQGFAAADFYTWTQTSYVFA